MIIRRFEGNPIVRAGMDERIGDNLNGPSLIRVPSWIPNPLGRYYLYFAHHKGTFIRLACADRLEGPWRIHGPGALELEEAFCNHHIASPDLHVMEGRREIWMYYHGASRPHLAEQQTRLAVSRDGLHFTARPEVLGSQYWRVFQWEGFYYALEMPGRLRRSKTGVSGFEEGPLLFTPSMRHAAVRRRGDRLHIYYSNAGDCPERILRATVRLRGNWLDWKAGDPVEVLTPETEYEGADLPLEPSKRGIARARVRQLRDPCVYEEGEQTFLLYSVAGEHGIALAEISGGEGEG
jgi:hypothetical protein